MLISVKDGGLVFHSLRLHKGNKLEKKNYARSHKVVRNAYVGCMDWSPSSPDLKPIENIWALPKASPQNNNRILPNILIQRRRYLFNYPRGVEEDGLGCC
jgi:hypothetical protein